MLTLHDIIYNEILFESVLNEGGNAIANAERIPRNFIQPTFNQIKKQIIYPIFGKDNDIFLLGSTGKKETSGDMDIRNRYFTME
jgi:hypothetical protein